MLAGVASLPPHAASSAPMAGAALNAARRRVIPAPPLTWSLLDAVPAPPLVIALCSFPGPGPWRVLYRRNGNDVASRRKNVLFLWTDQQRPDTIGACGNDLIRTP